MNTLHRRTYAEIDLSRLEANLKSLRSLAPKGAWVCPMVKANAYGHGDVEVARTLANGGASALGVGLVEEGMRLRSSGISIPLLLFGLFEESSVEAVLEHHLTPVISDWEQLEVIERHAEGPVRVHIKFNTGMNRLGFCSSEAPRLRTWLDEHRKVRLEGIGTHLLRGEDAGQQVGDSITQLQNFERALQAFQGLTFQAHALNSSASLSLYADPNQQPSEFVRSLGLRLGISVYGVSATGDLKSMPSGDSVSGRVASEEQATSKTSVVATRLALEPVLSFRSHLVMLHRVKVDDVVSYNGIWRAQRPSLIGVVPVGYADGYQRQFSNSAFVLCRGYRVPVVGTVCMDYFMVDLTDVAAATGEIFPGEEIVLLGEQQGAWVRAEELAARAQTITYEIFTRISDRVPRHYLR